MKVAALAGGVGGAKLADGLYRVSSLDDKYKVSIIGNTADDFTLWGLRISPDMDTVLYTLGGIANPATGWGIAGDTWTTLDALTRLGVDTWFRVGDQDFATHIRRTQLLAEGHTHTAIAAQFTEALGIRARLLPMCDEPVETVVDTPAGRLPFQEYFVRRRHADTVLGVEFSGIATARMTDAVQTALHEADVVVFCPSNPIVSLGPILAVPGLRATVAALSVPRIGISPIIGGAALKGPAAHMLRDLGQEASALGVARLYHDLLTHLVIDHADAVLAPEIERLGLHVHITDTVMHTDADRQRLAHEVLNFVA